MIQVKLIHLESKKELACQLITLKPREICVDTEHFFTDLETGLYEIKTGNSAFDFQGAITKIQPVECTSDLILTLNYLTEYGI
jgi:hypothetical protein